MKDYFKKFGYGLMKNEKEDLGELLSKGAKVKKQDLFSRSISSMIMHTLNQLVVPWMAKCLTRYSQYDFHYRLSPNFCVVHQQQHMEPCKQFDFIQDWYDNHSTEYSMFIKATRKVRNYFDFDEQIVFNQLMHILQNGHGWDIMPHERQKIWENILQVKAAIYSDSV